MNNITSYNTLIQAVQRQLEDDSVEFSTYLPTAVSLGEERLFRELDLPELEETQTGVLLPGSSTITKPSGCRLVDYVAIQNTSNATYDILGKKLPSFVRDYGSPQGTPKYYMDKTSTQLQITPVPQASTNYEIRYTAKPTGLSTSVASNYFIEKCPSILYGATVIEMILFMKAFSQLPTWQGYYDRLMEAWNIEAMRYRRDGGVNPMSSEGPNTIKHTVQTNA